MGIDDIFDALPGTPQQKAGFAAVAVAIYAIAAVVQGFTRENTIAHKICDAIISGWKPRPPIVKSPAELPKPPPPPSAA